MMSARLLLAPTAPIAVSRPPRGLAVGDGGHAACRTGWTPALNASWSAACFGVTERASSLRGCVEACAEQGAVPACIGSEEENNFAAALLGRGDWAFLGLYQSDTSGGAGEGWARCVAGAAPGFTNWAAGNPDDMWGPLDCAVVLGQGDWWSWPCEPSALGWTAPRCLCAGPANASASFATDLDELEATWAAYMRETRATVAVLYPIFVIVALLPSLLLLCRRAVSLLRRRRRADAASTSTEAEASTSTEAEASTRTEAEASHSATANSLRAARRSAAQRRLQVSGAMGQAGWALGVLGGVPFIMALIGNAIDAVVGPWTYWALLFPPGAYLLLLALLPTDARAIRAVCAVLFAVCLLFGALLALIALAALKAGDLNHALGLRLPGAMVLLVAGAALAPTLPCHGCRRTRVMEPRQALRRLWRVLRLISAGLGVLFTCYNSAFLAIKPAAANDPKVPGYLAFGAAFLLCAALATPANRGRLHRLLGRLGSRGSEAEQASAVAALVSGANPEQALALAARRFRVLPVQRLTEPDLSTGRNRGGDDARALHARTEAARLGECDAFLSHSWSDEAAPKWRRLQEWHAPFAAAHGRGSTLWLDKARPRGLQSRRLRRAEPLSDALSLALPHAVAGTHQACLDQDDVAANLRCLPIFLAGCKRLLILAGPSYPTRLWCVMEIFTFLHMGGGLERIDIHPLLVSAAEGQSDRQASRDRLMAQFATFDAAKAQCFLPKDRQRLLAVVEAGFGDFKDFNTRVRAIFAARRMSISSRRSTGTLAIPSVAVQDDSRL